MEVSEQLASVPQHLEAFDFQSVFSERAESKLLTKAPGNIEV